MTKRKIIILTSILLGLIILAISFWFGVGNGYFSKNQEQVVSTEDEQSIDNMKKSEIDNQGDEENVMEKSLVIQDEDKEYNAGGRIEDENITTMDIEDFIISFPSDYTLVKNEEELEAKEIFPSYSFQKNGEHIYPSPMFHEIRFFPEESVKEIIGNCQSPYCSIEDYPSVKEYYKQKEYLLDLNDYDERNDDGSIKRFVIGWFHDRTFFVSHKFIPEAMEDNKFARKGDKFTIRKYTTYINDTRIEVSILYSTEGSGVRGSEELFKNNPDNLFEKFIIRGK